ncbi:MAG TPA: YgiQ family radical SAM protein [Syntrophomonadaceae bacterium]|nr:YgiQ family radical SAM protein [Syntrophomonadaceae bacterium]
MIWKGYAMDFLPVTREDIAKRGWDELDIILVSGDAYVDHPAWAAAILGRFLEQYGFKVGIIAQPDWHSIKDISRLGQPRLFFGVSAGNIDSMVNHYTADRKKRHEDAFSPGGVGGKRPDRAAIVYTNLIRQAFPGVPVIIGGVEASLRRLAHYDYWSDKVRRSLLVDSKADLLVYGMGEYALLQIARYLKAGHNIKYLTGMRGTCYISGKCPPDSRILPSYEKVSTDKTEFSQATRIIHQELNPYCARVLAQAHGERWVVQNQPPMPLTTEEMDNIYKLQFLRRAHPMYDKAGGVPALKPVQFSLLTHRGCFGGCAFCSLGLHQGKFIQSRSIDSIIREAKTFLTHPDFKGSIPDVGAPSANMFGLQGNDTSLCRQCRRSSCLYPRVCANLNTDQTASVKLWRCLRSIKEFKHIRVASGVRYDLILKDSSGQYLRELCRYHVGGQLKIAPEHISDQVTRSMHKPGRNEYVRFIKEFKRINKDLGKDQYIIPYFISAHPGSHLSDTVELAEFVHDQLQYYPEQVQNFTPTPMTMSTSMYYTGLDPESGEKVYVPDTPRERRWQRALLQYQNKNNWQSVREALKVCGRDDLIGSSPRCLVKSAGDIHRGSAGKKKFQSRAGKKNK